MLGQAKGKLLEEHWNWLREEQRAGRIPELRSCVNAIEPNNPVSESWDP